MSIIFTTSTPCENTWKKLLFEESVELVLRNFYKVVHYELSVPVSNSLMKRVFSIMANIWTNEQNGLHFDVVEGEHQSKLNFGMSYGDFYDYVSQKPELFQEVSQARGQPKSSGVASKN